MLDIIYFYRSMPSFTAFFAVLIATVPLAGQNLIFNGGFEKMSRCPDDISMLTRSAGWFSPDDGTPDLFCKCNKDKLALVGVPVNFAGVRNSHKANCYAGIAVSRHGGEFICGKLSEPLKKGGFYRLSYFYSHADHATMSVGSLGAILTSADPRSNESNDIRIKLQDSIVNDKNGWRKLCLFFEATGDEQFVMIGCITRRFSTFPARMPPMKYRMMGMFDSPFAYYMIDDVSLVEMSGPDNFTCMEASDSVSVQSPTATAFPLKEGKIFILRSLNFETDKSEILASSFPELNKLADHMIAHPELKLEITGHTDSSGVESSNKGLSAARAKSTGLYLQKKGIIPARLNTKGAGSSKPVAPNSTPAGRAKNRRVEFRFAASPSQKPN
jgi:OOP family OmpA-OmpF porin